MSTSQHNPRGHAAFATLKPLCVPLVEPNSSSAQLLAHVSSLAQCIPTLDPNGVRACFQYVIFPLAHILRASTAAVTELVRMGALHAVAALVQLTGIDTREQYVELVLLLLDLITQISRSSGSAIPHPEEFHALIWTTLDCIVRQGRRHAEVRDLLQHPDFRVTLGFMYVGVSNRARTRSREQEHVEFAVLKNRRAGFILFQCVFVMCSTCPNVRVICEQDFQAIRLCCRSMYHRLYFAAQFPRIAPGCLDPFEAACVSGAVGGRLGRLLAGHRVRNGQDHRRGFQARYTVCACIQAGVRV
jgi:hypothetical protein